MSSVRRHQKSLSGTMWTHLISADAASHLTPTAIVSIPKVVGMGLGTETQKSEHYPCILTRLAEPVPHAGVWTSTKADAMVYRCTSAGSRSTLQLDVGVSVSSSAPQAPPPRPPGLLPAAPPDHGLLCRGHRGLLHGHLAVQDLRPEARLQRRRQPGEFPGPDDGRTLTATL